MSAEAAQYHWRSMVICFRRSQQQKKKLPTGSGAGAWRPYVFWDQMQFLIQNEQQGGFVFTSSISFE